jgi:pimeloyl-ACP methyl ester carboxylesterase
MPLIETVRGAIYCADHRRDTPHSPLVLVHGAGGSRLDWPGTLRRLPETRVIALDLPGHGKSPGPGKTRIADYAADVVALLDALEIPQAVIAGHSMGGGVAQMIGLDYADRAAGLVLLGTGAKLRVHPNILDRILTAQESVALLLKDWYWSEEADDSLRMLTYRQIMETPPEIVHGDYVACDAFDVRERLAEIRAPVLVIGGTADKMTPYKYSIYLQQHIPGAALVTVEGGGHMMTLEQPEFVGEAVHEWLAERVRLSKDKT